MFDYYDKVGCCLTCPDSYEGCLCVECLCTQCSHYEKEYYDSKGYCILSLERKDKWEEVSIEIDAWLKETAKAYLVVVDGGYIWVPKSLAKIGGSDALRLVSMPKWLAVKKRLWELDESDYWKGVD